LSPAAGFAAAIASVAATSAWLASPVASAPVVSGPVSVTGWSQPATVGGCSGAEAPWVVFPSDGPDHATGAGAIVWSTGRRCPGGERVLVAAVGPADRPAPGARPRTAGGRRIGLQGPLAVAGGPYGRIVIAAFAPTGPAHGLFTQGAAGGPFTPAAPTTSPASPTALASAYLGDVALASASVGARGRTGIRLRIERHHGRGFAPRGPVSAPAAGRVRSLRVALDYRSDALAVWWQRGAIYARVLPAAWRAHATARLAAAGPDVRIAAVVSDDDRAIVAWAAQRGSRTSVYLDMSAPGVRFHRPRLLERFTDPGGLRSPSGSPSLIRLSSESVMLAWAGVEGGRWVVRTAPVDLHGVRTVSTIPTPGADALLAALAPGPDGEALALWSEPQPTPRGGADLARQAIFAARGIDAHPGVSIFGRPEQVATPGPNSDATVAFDPDSDRALAVWRGAGGTIEYALGPSSQR